jgi:hypothetical protein
VVPVLPTLDSRFLLRRAAVVESDGAVPGSPAASHFGGEVSSLALVPLLQHEAQNEQQEGGARDHRQRDQHALRRARLQQRHLCLRVRRAVAERLHLVAQPVHQPPRRQERRRRAPEIRKKYFHFGLRTIF